MAFINGKEILFSTVIGSGADAITIELTKEGGVTTLSITDASGTQTATINDGVSIASVEQTATSTEDGGENTLTITLSNGTKTDFIVRNGSKGEKGDTPTKGTDYFTEKEKAEIVNEVVSLVPSYDVATEKIYLDYSEAYLKLTIDNLLDGNYASFQPFDLVCVGSDGMPLSSICTIFVEQYDQVRMLVYDSKHQTFIMYPQYYSSEDGNVYLYFSTNGEYLQVFIRGLVEKCTGASLEIIEALPDGVLDIDIERHAIAGESSGNANIDVTAEVGQTIIVKEVDENGKPTKWEAADYQERICWTKDILLYNGTPDWDAEVNQMYFTAPAPTVGAIYRITWKGAEYTCICFNIGGAPAMGNIELAQGLGDTGEPFLMVYDSEWLCMPLDGTAASIPITMTKVDITPIPTKYVRNAFPYYVDILVDSLSATTYTCNETVANLEAIYASGRAIVLRIVVSNEEVHMLAGAVYNLCYVMPAIGAADNSAFSSWGTNFCFSCAMSKSVIATLWLYPNEDGTYTVKDSLD